MPLSIHVVLLPVWFALASGVAVGAAGAQSAWGGALLAAVLGYPVALVTAALLTRSAERRGDHAAAGTWRLLPMPCLFAIGRALRVQGLDAIDGTPVVDLKPYFSEFGPRGDVRQPACSHELMAGRRSDGVTADA